MHLDSSSPVGITDIAAWMEFLTPTSSNPYPIAVTPLLEILAFTDTSFIPSSQDPFILLTKKAKNNPEQLSENPPPSMNQNNPIPLFLVNGNLPGSTPIYASLALPPSVPTSLLEMSLQGQSLTFSVLMDNKIVIILIQSPDELPIPNYAVLSHPYLGNPNSTPMKASPLLETPIISPILRNLQDLDPLYHHWTMQGQTLGVAPIQPNTTQTGSMASTRTQTANNNATTSQVPTPLNLVQYHHFKKILER
ncbi:hypothetical protein KY285_008212 [Solanum tuberosum]|nr:hypothetical protein KY285_008212 [Solanum tuberosum]